LKNAALQALIGVVTAAGPPLDAAVNPHARVVCFPLIHGLARTRLLRWKALARGSDRSRGFPC
ncbi:MAG: hypothetical protein ACE15E_13335, partial [Acidobacteriota bacterium]